MLASKTVWAGQYTVWHPYGSWCHSKEKYVMWRWEGGEVAHTWPRSWRPLWQAWGNAAVDRGTGHAQRGWQDFSNCKFLIFVLLFPVEGLQRWRADMERLGNEWNQGTWYEIPKESIKLYFKKKQGQGYIYLRSVQLYPTVSLLKQQTTDRNDRLFTCCMGPE